MSIFPINPTIGDRYSGYEWDGTSWNVVGINLNAEYATTTDLSDHEADTSNVHGIVDTSLLATTSYVDTAESDAITTANNYSDSLASNYDPAGSASTAQSNAESYTDTAIGNLVDTAPSTLDTLNELAAALGDDENFSTTIATSVGTKQDKSSAITIVDNGTDPNYARPTGVGAVYWIGSAEPVNAEDYDMWWSG
jgi:hypothetical protein